MDDYDFDEAPRRRRSSGLVGRAVDAALRNPVMAAGALISGLAIIVIVTNALANQPMRHPSPLFNTRAVTSVTSVTTTPVTVASVPVQSAQTPQTTPAVQPTTAPVVPLQLQPPSDAEPVLPVVQPVAVNPPALTTPPTGPNQQLTLRVQQALHDRGFYTGAVDGIAGPATAESIRAFEQRLGVAATGDVNDRVLALLDSRRGRQATPRPQVAAVPQAIKPIAVSAPVAQRPVPQSLVQLMPAPVPPEPLTGSTEGRLQKVQRALNVAGYGPLRPDGRLDDKTVEAIRKFEAEHGMPITGKISDRLVSELVVRSAQAR
jgi:peptidoglycan hydrolase-like protein with peptidoglycan-binding domain